MLHKLLKYLTLIECAFSRGVALTGKEENLPLMKIKVLEKQELEGLEVVPVMVHIALDGQERLGLLMFQLSDDRIRIVGIPFDPDRISETIESERGKEFLETVLILSFDLYEADYAIKLAQEGKKVLVVQNDLLMNFITYDELEEELFGVIHAIVMLYNVLKEKGFEPKLLTRKISSDEKIDEEFLDLFYTRDRDFYLMSSDLPLFLVSLSAPYAYLLR